MKIDELNGKKILIVGGGLDGRSAESFIKKNTTATVTVVDQHDGPDYLNDQSNYDLAIRSPGVNKKLITIPSTTPVNLFFQLVQGKTIGVTGTKGKSTTASLIAHVLQQSGQKAHLAGNIGVPVLTALSEFNTPEDIWVLELSSYMLDDVQFSPDMAVVINLYPEHLDYHGSVDAYYNAKKNIVLKMHESGVFVYNQEFPELKQWAEETKARCIPYQQNSHFLQQKNFKTLLKGAHNQANIQAVYTLVQQLDITDEQFGSALETFQPLRHRLQTVGTFHTITFVDDAISTTPESTLAALEAVKPVGSLFLGGLDRGYEFSALVDQIIQLNIQTIVFFPDSGRKILGMLKERQFTPAHLLETSSMEEAVRFMFEHTPAGTVCLLSTASPSYSVWKNFEEKGDDFQKWVEYYGRTTDQKETTNRQENSEQKQSQDKTESVSG